MQLYQQVDIDRHGCLRDRGGIEAQAALDLAASQMLANHLANTGLQGAELLGHANEDLEITMIDRTHLPHEFACLDL